MRPYKKTEDSVSFAHSAAAGNSSVMFGAPAQGYSTRRAFCLQGVRHGVICVAACSSPFPFVNEHTFVFFISEVYEAATLPAETLPQKLEIQGGTPAIFFVEFWSKSEYPYSGKCSSNFVHFSVDVRCIWGGGYPPPGTTFCGQKSPVGPHGA